MSVLLELSIFPTDKGASVSAYVAPIVKLIKDSGLPCKLTAMGTIIETDELSEGLALVEKAHALLRDGGCRRVYATLKIDSREGPSGRLEGKIASVVEKIGD